MTFRRPADLVPLRLTAVLFGVACLAVPLFSASPAAAAKVTRLPGHSAIVISGEIVHGDEERFIALLAGSLSRGERPVTILASSGGRVRPALAIGRAIHDHGLVTAVGDVVCTSSCALIWAAGSVRFMSPGARLGFHQVYDGRNGRATARGNADVAKYLARVTNNVDLMSFAMRAPPEGMAYLTYEGAVSIGLDVRRFGTARRATVRAYAPRTGGERGRVIANETEPNGASSPLEDAPDGANALRAVDNVRAAYRSGGSSALVAASRACWEVVRRKGTARAYQYCVVLDVTGEYLIDQARQSVGRRKPDWLHGRSIRERVAGHRSFVVQPALLPDRPLKAWGGEAYALLRD